MKIKDAAVPLGSLIVLALVGVAIHENGIHERIAVKTLWYASAGERLSQVLERMSRLSASPGSDLTPFHEIAETELREMLRLDQERRALKAELWLGPGKR